MNSQTPGLWLDSDGSNLFIDDPETWASADEFVRETVQTCAPEVGTYLMCSNAGQCYFPTQVSRMRPDTRRLGEALGEDDLFGRVLTGLKATGRDVLITMRMNDVHNPTDASRQNITPLREQHPDLIVAPDEAAAGTGGWMAYCLDYTQEPVQRFQLALLEEIAHRYADVIDGVQLDWMRFPRHLPGPEPWAHRDALTGFVREARRVVSKAGGHLRLGARVPPTIDGCHATGMDLPTWTREPGLDWLTLCPFLTTNWAIDFTAFRGWIGEPCPTLVGGFDFAFDTTYHHPESLRGVAAAMHDRGADGVYLFNFPCWIEYLADRPYHWLAGLDRPHAAAKPMLLSVDHAHFRQTHCDGPAVLPRTLAAGEDALPLSIRVPRCALPAARGLVLIHSDGEVEASMNGQPLRPWRYRKRDHPGAFHGRSELFMQYHDHHRFVKKRPAFDDCRVFRLDPAFLRAGANRIDLHPRGSDILTLERLHLGLW